jgi:hypothetical protein
LAPLRGSLHRPLLVPVHTSPLSRGALRSAGVPTVAASTTPAPRAGPALPGSPRHLGRLFQAQGNTPCAPRGGLCGCLAVRQTFLKPSGVPTGWGRRKAEPFRAGLLLGRLGGVFRALSLPDLACRPRSGEFRRGKQM